MNNLHHYPYCYYIEMREILGYYIKNNNFILSATPNDLPSGKGWGDMVKKYCLFDNYLGKVNSILDTAEVHKLLQDYVLPRIFYDNVVLTESYEDNIDVNTNEDVIKFVWRVTSFLISTQPYYKKIIDSYTQQENNLLDPIKNVSKFNDLPQTEFISTENHLTNITQNENDALTPIQRLSEIRDELDNTFERWALEFINQFRLK